MSELVEIVVHNSLGLSPEAGIALGNALGETFLPEEPSRNHRNWSSVTFDIDLTQDAVVAANQVKWWDFCTSPIARLECYQHARKLMQVFSSNEVLFSPETASLAANSMEGWSWQQMGEHLEKKYGGPRSNFIQFSEPTFGDTDEEADLLDCYFSFSRADILEQLQV